VTLFDLIAIVILLVSGLVGFTRGAVRELVTVFAFILAALAAVYLLPIVGPLAQKMMQPAWAANAAAVVAAFIVTYIALRVLGGWITSKLHQHAALGTLDRSIGLGFGVVRALAFLGVFYLVFNMATPPELVPRWISEAKLYPLARSSGRLLGTAAPKALKASGRIGPALERAVEGGDDAGATGAGNSPSADGSAPQSRSRNAPLPPTGYDKRSRDDIDALVERSR